MERNFFRSLPKEITTNILSRLPIRSIALSKCVCKAWLNLLDFDDFEFKSPHALALLQQMDSIRCSIFDIEDEDDEEKSHDLHYIPLTDFDIPHENSEALAAMAANGLILLHSKLGFSQIPLFICNPITHQYIELWGPPEEYILDDVVVVVDDDDDDVDPVFCFGFGVSKISGQYKVVCINANTDFHYVYTLGTGTWRRIAAGAASGLGIYTAAHIVYNGNLHGTGAYYSPHTLRICDIENECFTIFAAPPPPPPVNGHSRLTGELSTLRDCLCYSYPWEDEIVIWSMTEYHVEESWTILYKISCDGFDFDRASGFGWNYMCVKPIKLFKDGDVLMLLDEKRLIYYSNKARTIQQVGMFEDAAVKDYVSALIFTPSLFSLKNFGFKNVISF